ncbi:type II toxin-antitoxin system HicB family antitoxin [Loigolactobacillus coryniformis]|uniref:HicB family protein n=1 Tax=Loigolactobacillus coryniformis TaxID=1610 RepID=A0A5B8TL81_9LACO|nr:type II toxin-antitoxin system HicB family antitoxin [Loigolactobacillus coryniformis]QEA53161.1 HicB family protein [Loigolactobacillus coryniformis]RRG05704.1 MAG: HicB family protein [Lactobacillus sp.]
MSKINMVIYPAILTSDEGNTIDVTFPDVPAAITFGNSFKEAVVMGAEALGLALYGQRNLPEPSDIRQLKLASAQQAVLIAVDLAEFKKRVKTPMVKKNTTVPRELALAAEQQGINFSEVLTEALKAKLGA